MPYYKPLHHCDHFNVCTLLWLKTKIHMLYYTYLLTYVLTYTLTYIHLLTYYLVTYLITYLHTYLLAHLLFLTYSLTHSLTHSMEQSPWEGNRSQLFELFPTFCGTWRFITAFTSVHHLSLSRVRSIQSMPPIPIPEDPS